VIRLNRRRTRYQVYRLQAEASHPAVMDYEENRRLGTRGQYRLQAGATPQLSTPWTDGAAEQRPGGKWSQRKPNRQGPLAKARSDVPAHVRVLVLFSGLGSVERAIHKQFPGRAEVVTVDMNGTSANPPTHAVDILQWVLEDEDRPSFRQYPPGYFDIIWASPECTQYSKGRTTGKARNLEQADACVRAALLIMETLQPTYWFVENPKGDDRPGGSLSGRPLMHALREFKHLCSYCMYGSQYQKLTYIWTNAPGLELKACSAATPCPSRVDTGGHPQTAQAGPHKRTAGPQPGTTAPKAGGIPSRLLHELFSTLRWGTQARSGYPELVTAPP